MAASLPDMRTNQNTGRYTGSDHRLYQFCNSVYELARSMQRKGFAFYALGFYRDVSGSDLAFMRRFMRDLQNEGYYDVVHTADLTATFRQIAGDILSGPASGERPSSWATAEVNESIRLGLVPRHLQSAYASPITRAEFCALAVAHYEKARGAEITVRKTFDDTADVNVQKMAALGVVLGVGGNRFDPNGLLTREQAAVILDRLAIVVGKPLPVLPGSFGDMTSIASWARESVGKVQAGGIMDGTGSNNFTPKMSYSREQSIVTLLRLWKYGDR